MANPISKLIQKLCKFNVEMYFEDEELARIFNFIMTSDAFYRSMTYEGSDDSNFHCDVDYRPKAASKVPNKYYISKSDDEVIY